MMNLQELTDTLPALNLQLLTGPSDLAALTPVGVYTSDLLSCVMAGAHEGDLWVTLQGHMNVVAVAALLELSAVIITEGVVPEPAVLEKAQEKGVTLLATHCSSYEVCGRLWELGLRQAEQTG
jgi:hypothetical protein